MPVISRNGSGFIGIASEYISFVVSGIFYGKKIILNQNKKFDKIFVYGTSPITQALVSDLFKKEIKNSNNFVGTGFVA